MERKVFIQMSIRIPSRARILLFDTTAHSLPWPLFLEDLHDLVNEESARYAYTFVDEAKFLRERSVTSRLLTRTLDWFTMNVHSRRCRSIAYESATRLLRYRRHSVSRSHLNDELVARVRVFKPDLVLVLMGFHIEPDALAAIRTETRAIMVNYATDDPFNRRTGTPELIRGIPFYDLYASTKRAVIPDLKRAGARSVRFMRFGYKSSVHFLDLPVTASEQKRFAADVAFVGEGDADRLPFMRALSEAIPNLNLALYGGLWNRQKRLRRYFRGSVRGRDFRMALSGAKIVVNLVRRENRDDHVMRTFEGPACGAFMLNERTDTHLEHFKEGREAAYFESSTELVEKVRHYLVHQSERERIRQAGHLRTITGRHSYRDRLVEILETTLH